MSTIYSNYIKREIEGLQEWGKDSLNRTFEKAKDLVRKLLAKSLDFIQMHNSGKQESYFSFEIFKNEIAPNSFADPNTLLSFYEENFSDTLKSSYEGKLIRNMIEARFIANAKSTQKKKAPIFSTTDIFGKTINLKDDFGKRMVLINFWASWCGPCLAELPAIKKIETEFPSSQLRIISVSYDIDTLKFNNARSKYKMDWTNIYQDIKLRTKFGANNSLPQLFLIDTKGNIIYNRSMDETDFTKLKQLNYILKKQIK